MCVCVCVCINDLGAFAIRPRESAFGMHTRIYVTRMQIGTYYISIARLPITHSRFSWLSPQFLAWSSAIRRFTPLRVSARLKLFHSPNRATCLARPFANYFVHEDATRGRLHATARRVYLSSTWKTVRRASRERRYRKNSIRNVNSISEMISGRPFPSQNVSF